MELANRRKPPFLAELPTGDLAVWINLGGLQPLGGFRARQASRFLVAVAPHQSVGGLRPTAREATLLSLDDLSLACRR
jgi:hypothetical protein